ncbi:hypothetical protein GEMRC1_012019 [Eukaryota sp. GEM-RC1]
MSSIGRQTLLLFLIVKQKIKSKELDAFLESKIQGYNSDQQCEIHRFVEMWRQGNPIFDSDSESDTNCATVSSPPTEGYDTKAQPAKYCKYCKQDDHNIEHCPEPACKTSTLNTANVSKLKNSQKRRKGNDGRSKRS